MIRSIRQLNKCCKFLVNIGALQACGQLLGLYNSMIWGLKTPCSPWVQTIWH